MFLCVIMSTATRLVGSAKAPVITVKDIRRRVMFSYPTSLCADRNVSCNVACVFYSRGSPRRSLLKRLLFMAFSRALAGHLHLEYFEERTGLFALPESVGGVARIAAE